MATYKVIQDIEAEDKLLGPLGLRQFIYALIVGALGFIAFKLAFVHWVLVIPFLPPMVLFGLLAAPFGKDQSSEVWLLAKIRFALKPRRRIWDQTGLSHLVTITAPKKVERQLTDGLSQSEVKSRLKALADTIDSRGWAIKNVNVNLYAQPSFAGMEGSSDRLINAGMLSQQVPADDITATDDMLDERNNRVAQQLDQMINATAQARRQELRDQMQQAGSPAPQPQNPATNQWFMDNGTTPNANETTFLKRQHEEAAAEEQSTSHLKTVEPASGKKDSVVEAKPQEPKPEPRAEVTALAQDNNLSVATIAKQASEVVISLR